MIRIHLPVLLFAAMRMITAAAANVTDETAVGVAAETVLSDINNAMSTTRLMNRASPQCWRASITTMSRWEYISGSSYCASMTTEQQKVLALELTNCQLMEENRSLFVNDEMSTQLSEHASCHVGKNGSEPYEVSSCLRFMSDFALSLYHQMLLYANDMCNRLTHDLMEQQKEETTRMLIEASSSFVELTRKLQMEADLAQQSREQAMEEAISRNNLYLKEHQQQWEEVNQARQMEFARAQEARENAAEAREREVEAREKTALLAMEKMIAQNMIHFQEQQRKWDELNSAHVNEMHIVEQRREQTEAIIKKQQYDMERMQEVIANTNSQMLPLSSIHSYVKMATCGFTLLKSSSIFFLSMNASWMITAIPLLNRARRSLYGVFFIGFVVELAAMYLAEDTSLADDGVDFADLIRCYTRVSAFVTCVISFLIACIYPKRESTSDINMDELLKRQMEIVSMIGAQQMEQNARTSMMMQNPLASPHDTMEQQRAGKREEASGNSFIITNPNFKPPRRQRQVSPYQPYHKPMSACVSPMASRHYTATAESAVNRMANTVTPNNRIQTQNDYEVREIFSEHVVKHVPQVQSNAESFSDESGYSFDEDVPVPIASTKKKRKLSELETDESEDDESASEDQSKVNETKKKKSKLEKTQLY